MLKSYKNRLIRFLALKYLESEPYYYNSSSDIKSKINLVTEKDKMEGNYIGDYYQNLTIYKNDYWIISSYMQNRRLINKDDNQRKK